jgi:hypothetical protein
MNKKKKSPTFASHVGDRSSTSTSHIEDQHPAFASHAGGKLPTSACPVGDVKPTTASHVGGTSLVNVSHMSDMSTTSASHVGDKQPTTAMLELVHTHLKFIFPKVFPMFIGHYSVSYILGRIFL